MKNLLLYTVLSVWGIAGTTLWVQANNRMIDPDAAYAQREYLQKNGIPLIEFQPSEKFIIKREL